MEKNIKDYLHLYLGCDVLIESYNFMEGNKPEKIIDILVQVRTDGCIDCKKYTPPVEDVKPILRPLSDMTEEEARRCYITTTNSRRKIEGWQVIDYYKRVDFLEASEFLFLLSKHFDLFGLIDAGLAIDKTTLKTIE